MFLILQFLRPILIPSKSKTAPFLTLFSFLFNSNTATLRHTLCTHPRLIVLHPGCTLILIVSPLAADLSVVVEEKEKENPGIFGPGGAYAQAFALFNCSMAAATLFGPVFAGALMDRFGWKVMSLALGIFAVSGAIPSVSCFLLFRAFVPFWQGSSNREEEPQS